MESTTDIMQKVIDQMMQMKDIQRCKYSDGDIKEVCNNCKYALTVRESVFACCQLPNPCEVEIAKAEKNINLGMMQMRTMGLSISKNLNERKSMLLNK